MSSPPPLRFQAHSSLWALLTAGPLLLFSAVLLALGWWISSWGWVAFSACATLCCLALVALRMPVTIDPASRTVRQAWGLGPIPIIKREQSLDGFDFIKLAPFSQRKGMMSRSIWRLLEPRYRITLFGEDGAVPLATFYKEASARKAGQQAADTLGLDLYDQLIPEEF